MMIVDDLELAVAHNGIMRSIVYGRKGPLNSKIRTHDNTLGRKREKRVVSTQDMLLK